jgi:hypothetical protein
MNPKALAGVSIGRRWATLLVVRISREGVAVLYQKEQVRLAGDPLHQCLDALLLGLPEDYRKLPISLALSPGDLACSDAWVPPAGTARPSLAQVLPVLCETRCAGEPIENLAMDVIETGSLLQAVAIRIELLTEVRRILKERGTRLKLLTAIPAALAQVFVQEASLSISQAGDEFSIRHEAGNLLWRSRPVDRKLDPEQEPKEVPWQKTRIPLHLAPAFAAAVADPNAIPDALRGAPGTPRSFAYRLRTPLLGFSVAAALFLAALGIRFEGERSHVLEDLTRLQEAEAALWKEHFPDQTFKVGGFLPAIRACLRESGAGADGTRVPSALDLCEEIAKQLPDVESTGMTLDTLDVTSEGARMVATLAQAPGDRMKYAAILEAALNQSDQITARGESEARDMLVQVRLRIDPRAAGAGNRR